MVNINQVHATLSSHFVTKTISVHSNLPFISTAVMQSTPAIQTDQLLDEDMISIFHTMPNRVCLAQILVEHTSLRQATAMVTVIPEHYWPEVITFILLKSKFTTLHKFYVLRSFI